jgi:hypothetical protein
MFNKIREAWSESLCLYVVSIVDMKVKGITPVRPILRINCFIYQYKTMK